MHRAVLVTLLGSILLAGASPWVEPSVCTEPCGDIEQGDCEIPVCAGCVNLGVVPSPPDAPAVPDAPVDVGPAEAGLAPPRIEPPSAEIPHVPRPLLG